MYTVSRDFGDAEAASDYLDVKNIASASDGEVLTGEVMDKVRTRYAKLHRELQAKGTRSGVRFAGSDAGSRPVRFTCSSAELRSIPEGFTILLQPPPEPQLLRLPGLQSRGDIISLLAQALGKRGGVCCCLGGARGRMRAWDERRVARQADLAECHAVDREILNDLDEGLPGLCEQPVKYIRQDLLGYSSLALYQGLPDLPLGHGVVVSHALRVREDLA